MLAESHAFSGFSTDDIAAARAFYQDTLGLEVSEEMGLLSIRFAGGGRTIVYPKPNHEPATFTVLNFPVNDLEATVDALTGSGIAFERYAGMNQDERGIARDDSTPPIAWFKDPAGNILAVLKA